MLCKKGKKRYLRVKISLILYGLYSAVGSEFLQLFESAHSLGTWIHKHLVNRWNGQWNLCIVFGDQKTELLKVLQVHVIIFIDDRRREGAIGTKIRL